jgi:ferredoxin-type protein NapF
MLIQVPMQVIWHNSTRPTRYTFEADQSPTPIVPYIAKNLMDIKRRSFLQGRSATAVIAPARPPWAATPDSVFAARCTRCGDCARDCPRKVLKIGDGGFPVIDFTEAGCSICGDCARVCTTGAIARAERQEPFSWRVKVSDTCLARQGVECRICGDACDAGALRFTPARGGISQMRIELESCTGCGECIATCPVQALAVE